MSTLTIDNAKIKASESDTLHRICADGKPTEIFLTTDEASVLQRVGPIVHPSVLETMFQRSPHRLQMLHNLLNSR
jgi:hypothetical protein